MSQENEVPENCFKKTLIWSLVNRKLHKSLSDDDVGYDAYAPLVEVLFPKIKYRDNEINVVVNLMVIPALNKLFPEIKGLPENDIEMEDMASIKEFFPINEYEWSRDSNWITKFNELLN